MKEKNGRQRGSEGVKMEGKMGEKEEEEEGVAISTSPCV